MRAWVILPTAYDEHATTRYPTVYWTHGFGAKLDTIRPSALMIASRMAAGKMPPMIWIFLDESLPTGTHEFADSVNNGPWGEALTTELIPDLERRWRMFSACRCWHGSRSRPIASNCWKRASI